MDYASGNPPNLWQPTESLALKDFEGAPGTYRSGCGTDQSVFGTSSIEACGIAVEGLKGRVFATYTESHIFRIDNTNVKILIYLKYKDIRPSTA